MDAVANVRIGACKVLPLLKKALQYHESVDVPKVNRPHRTPMHISTVCREALALVHSNRICATRDQRWQPYDGGLMERLVNCVLLLLKDGDSDVAVLAREVGFLPGNAHCAAVCTEAEMPINRCLWS